MAAHTIDDHLNPAQVLGEQGEEGFLAPLPSSPCIFYKMALEERRIYFDSTSSYNVDAVLGFLKHGCYDCKGCEYDTRIKGR